MKLKELAIDGIGNRGDLQLGGFGDGLTLVYGENGAGKTTIREFIRGTLFDIDRDLPINARYTAGRLKVTNGADEFQLSRDVHLNSEVDLRALTDLNGNGYSSRDNSLRKLVERLNVDLYDSVFSVSFRETPTNASRLASVLQNQLGVPSGPEAAGDDSAYLSWQRDTNERQQQAESLRLRIELLTAERNQCINQIESLKSGRQEQVNDVEQRLGQIRARINEIQSSSNQDRLQCTDREIAKLRTWIDSRQNHDPYVAPEVDLTAQYPAICQRLDDVDDQIRRWRHVQTEIQNQRVRVRDEMLVWNELTLDSEEHPYHYARAILVSLESKVDEAERNANHWGDAAAARVDTTPMARMLGQLCQGMRDELYGLCNELSQQYKHIRHKAAAAELKQLRRSYGEMGENIQHLIQRRDSLVREIRKLDPAGAEAIVRADVKFCECARQFGYFEARKRFVGPDVSSPAKSTYQVNTPNLHSEHARLALLMQQRRGLNAMMSGGDIELNELHSQQSELIRQRDVLLGESNLHDWSLKLQDIDGRLQLLNSEQCVAQRQLDLNRDFLPIQPNPLIHSACGLLGRMSGGDLTQVFLSEPIISVAGEKQIGLQVRDQYGKVLNFSAIDPGLQDLVYLCLMLAAKEQLKQQFIQAPTVIDDAFCRITSEHISATLNELNEFAAQGHQIIALTQHRYLADRVPSVPLLELPPTMPTLDPVITPDRHPVVTPIITPIPVPDWNPESFVTTDVYATSSLPRPYPLSKYPHSHSRHSVQDYGYTVSYPFPVFGQQQESNGQSNPVDVRTAPLSVHPVSANEIGDRLGYMSSIDESTRLDKVGFFDPTQLRMFQANGIVSVTDLMALEPDHARALGPHAEQIDRWQSQLWLLMNLPGLRINDARVLVSCGVTDPEHLDTSHPQQILERIERFFATSEGKRFAGDNESMTIERVNGWYRSLDATRPRWSNRSSNSNRQPNSSEQPSSDRQEFQPATISADRSTFDGTARAYQPRKRHDRDRAPRPTRAPIHARPPRMNTPVPERKVVPRVAPASKLVADKVAQKKESKTPLVVANRKLKFYLDLNDHVEAAPSIGPKTAERFEKIGITTVTDFLKQTAESMATKLNYKRITAKLIRDWQHQARLICRVPNLRGHDAQLLVACGVTEPEELSTMQPQNLFDIIGPFSETKDGLKIIRNGKKPDLAEVANWIAWAEQTRSLQAA